MTMMKINSEVATALINYELIMSTCPARSTNHSRPTGSAQAAHRLGVTRMRENSPECAGREIDIPRYDGRMTTNGLTSRPAPPPARDPEEVDLEVLINSQLSEAMLILSEVRVDLGTVGATGMVDDLRRMINDLTSMIDWSVDHQGWATDDLDPHARVCEDCKMMILNCEC
jgi:hypothetical protein